MAVMDEFKEERQALKNGTPKEKISYGMSSLLFLQLS